MLLIERDGPLTELLALKDRAASGRGAIAVVAGEAGIGKTSLMEELRIRSESDTRFIWGGCDALFTPRPLGPIHDMAHQFSERVRKLLSDGAKPYQLYTAVLGELEKTSGPVVLVFEDAHWADHATLDILKYLSRRIPFLPALLVITYRNDDVSPDHPLTQVLGDLPSSHTTRINLQPLTEEGVKKLSADSGHSFSELYAITGGNPFFVTELLAWSGDARTAIPASVKDAVSARLNRLAPNERAFLETISVIPGSVGSEILNALYGTEGSALAKAVLGRKLLVKDSTGALRFRHELARLATLSRLSATRQKTIHAQVLNALVKTSSGATFDQIVHHAASALDATRVLEFAPRAAESAAAVGAHAEAAAHLSTALRFIDEAEPEKAARLYENWAYEAGLALRIDDEVLEARRHAISLWRALGREDKVGENLRWLSRLHWYRGESTEARRFADEAVRVLENIPASAERAMAYSLRSQLHMLNDEMDEAVDWGRRALKLAEDFNDIEIRIHALNNVGTALAFRGKQDGIGLLEESLELALKHAFHEHAARVYTNLAEYGVEFKDFVLAERVISDGIAFDTQHDLDAWTHYLVGRQAQLRMEQGRLRDAETIAAGVLELDRLTLIMRLPALIVLAKTRLRLDHPDAARLLDEALTAALTTEEPQYIVPARLALIESAWLWDHEETAREHFEALYTLGAESMHKWCAGELCLWAKRFGTEAPEEFQSDLPRPWAAQLRGDHRHAYQEWTRLGAPYSAGLSLMKADNKQSGAQLAEALTCFRRIEANAAASKILRRAQALGVSEQMPRQPRGPYRATRNHPLGLTKREQEILHLMSEGATNREISERLSRSPRTVEHHVSSILNKLNVANRMEAILRIHNEPWLARADL